MITEDLRKFLVWLDDEQALDSSWEDGITERMDERVPDPADYDWYLEVVRIYLEETNGV